MVKMSRRPTAMSFAIDLDDPDDFRKIIDRDDNESNTLYDLIAPHVYEIEYNGHFGPSVFFTVLIDEGEDVDVVTVSAIQKVEQIIRDYIAGK